MYIYIYIYIYIYKFTSDIVRLPHPRSRDSQGQETFVAPSVDTLCQQVLVSNKEIKKLSIHHLHHVVKRMICHKAIVVITGRENYFHNFMITRLRVIPILLL